MWFRVIVFAAGLAVAVLPHPVLAQGSGAAGPASPPAGSTPEALDLSASQRQVVYTAISSKVHKSTAAPADFVPKIGDTVPPGVETMPIPDAVAELFPKLRGYQCALVANQALIIDPQSRRIVEVMNEAPAGAAPSRG